MLAAVAARVTRSAGLLFRSNARCSNHSSGRGSPRTLGLSGVSGGAWRPSRIIVTISGARNAAATSGVRATPAGHPARPSRRWLPRDRCGGLRTSGERQRSGGPRANVSSSVGSSTSPSSRISAQRAPVTRATSTAPACRCRKVSVPAGRRRLPGARACRWRHETRDGEFRDQRDRQRAFTGVLPAGDPEDDAAHTNPSASRAATAASSGVFTLKNGSTAFPTSSNATTTDERRASQA